MLYSNGAVNGTIASLVIVMDPAEDSFNLSSPSTLTGVTFGNWVPTGVTATEIQWLIVGSEGSLTPVCGLCSGTATLTPVASFANAFGFNVITQSFSLPNLTLAAGTYWLGLENETVSNELVPAGWDINGGSSLVWGTVAFDILPGDLNGQNCPILTPPFTTCSNSFEILGITPTAVPEPASLVLFGVGLAALGLIRRRRSA